MEIEHKEFILSTDDLNGGRKKINEEISFEKGVALDNFDYDELFTPGNYYTGGPDVVETSSGLKVKIPSSILVIGNSSRFAATQIQVPVAPQDQKFYYRTRITGSVWSKWFELAEGKPWNRGELPEGTNVYDMRGLEWEGVWNISGAATANSMQGETPPGLEGWLPGQIEVKGSGGGNTNLSSLTYTPYSGKKARVYAITVNLYSQTGRDAWGDWSNLSEKEQDGVSFDAYSGHAGVPNVARIEEFKKDYPLVSTEGKGAVMFRYDHGLTNFKQHIKPLHDAKGFPYCIAMNSRNWDEEENSGATQSEVKSWIADGLCEIWNHSATHTDSDIKEGLFDEIVNGRIELEQQLAIKVHGFIVPGMSPTGMGGFVGGNSLDVFSKTYAGTLIQSYHAVSSGAFSGTARRQLDGVVRIGQSHFGFEKRSVTEVKAQIDLAISEKTALQLMAHPRELNRGGEYYSTSDVAEILDYVEQKVNAGDLVVLSPYQSLHATI